LDYRSFLNADLAPSTADFTNIKFNWYFDLNPLLPGTSPVPGLYQVNLTMSPLKAPHDKAAVIERIGHSLNVGTPEGPAFVLLEGPSALHLDGYKLKNVIIRGATIVYHGGPIEMENVYFVNCTFEVPKTSNAQQVLAAVLASTPTTLKIS
jgi:hypothetical protein